LVRLGLPALKVQLDQLARQDLLAHKALPALTPCCRLLLLLLRLAKRRQLLLHLFRWITFSNLILFFQSEPRGRKA
jgi:hypothetical protein